MKTYPNYKDSGVEWLGEVPEGWEAIRLRRVASLISEKSDETINPIALENIESWTGKLIETESQFSSSGILFQSGDILFGKLRPYLAKVGLATHQGSAVGDIFVIRAMENLLPTFLQRTLLNSTAISVINSSTYGSKMPRVDWEFLANFPVPLPPLPEQRAIAAFLDHEVAKIDDLIAEQERLIELLAEKRQATISHAVTKGLDPNAKLKPSGVEWLGDVPEDWEVVRLRQCTRNVFTGSTPKEVIPDSELESSLPWFTPGDFPKGGSLRIGKSSKNFSEIDLSSAGVKIFPADSVLLVGIGTVGKVALSERRFSCNQQINVIVPSITLDPEFLAASLSAQTSAMRMLSNSTTIGILNQEKTKDFSITLPNLSQQRLIICHLNQLTIRFDSLTAAAREAIALLQERRSSLISAAVTGKMDVRDFVAAEEESA